MSPKIPLILLFGLTILAIVAQVEITQGQIFDQLFSDRNRFVRADGEVGQSQTDQPKFRSRIRDLFNVNVPFFYDMVKNGSSMGINVLSGLVRVDRGEEAVRTGLTGSRPLSVRVFGIPVYDRGTRVGSPTRGAPVGGSGGREAGGEEEELPIY